MDTLHTGFGALVLEDSELPPAQEHVSDATAGETVLHEQSAELEVVSSDINLPSPEMLLTGAARQAMLERSVSIGPGVSHLGLANLMALCTTQCRTSLPQPFMVQLLWSHANKFWFKPTVGLASISTNNTQNDEACLHLVKPVLDLLSALLPKMLLKSSTPHAQSSGSSAGSDKPSGGNNAHTKAAAAKRAARVLQDRKNAESVRQGPYPVDMLYLVASALQVVDTLCRFHAGRVSAAVINLIEAGKLFETLYTVTSFLLRCARDNASPPLLPATNTSSPSDDRVQRATYQTLCYASISMFQTLLDIEEPYITCVTGRIPDHMFDMLGCLACEGLLEADEAGWYLACQPSDALLGKLTPRQASSLLYCPSMQLLSRRVIPYAIRLCENIHYPRVETALTVIALHHSHVAVNYLLSENFTSSTLWPNLESSSITPSIGYVAQHMAPRDNTLDAYFEPLVRDHSMQQVSTLLPRRRGPFFTHTDGRIRSTSDASVHLSRLTAVLLSLQHPTAFIAVGRRGIDAVARTGLEQSLLAVARFSSALATQLLISARTKHSRCSCGPIFWDDSDDDSVQDSLGALSECYACSAHAEGIMAILLQVLPLHQRLDTECSGGPAAFPAPERLLLEGWMCLPGVAVAVEACMRSMGRSEHGVGQLRPLALQLLMVDCDLLPRSWSGMFRDCTGHASRGINPCVSLVVSLFKSLRLELSQEHYSTSAALRPGYQQPVSMALLLRTIGNFTAYSREVWEGLDVAGERTSVGGSQLSTPSLDDLKLCQTWLRMQLILLRSWFLLWVDLSRQVWASGSNSLGADCASTARDIQKAMTSAFLLEHTAGPASPLLEAALVACGFTLSADWRVSKDVREGHTRWERFAFLHLQGRALPGCSHWGCDNLDGFSEEALPTQLCGGCRRARYCSARCQMAAWVEGGHREVCGGIIGCSLVDANEV